jgi:hypothetical protein
MSLFAHTLVHEAATAPSPGLFVGLEAEITIGSLPFTRTIFACPLRIAAEKAAEAKASK